MRVLIQSIFCSLVIIAGLAVATGAAAKPAVTSSEQTAAKLCIENASDYAEMRDLCEAALAERDLSPALRADLLTVLGDAMIGLDQYEAARGHLAEAMSLAPEDVDPRNTMAWALYFEDRDAEAYDLFASTLNMRPTDEGYAGLAASGYAAGALSIDEALKQIDTALIIDPEYRWAIRQKGWMLHDVDRWEDAVAAFDRALEILPDDANALYGRAKVLQQTGDSEEALVAINRAIEVNDQRHWYYLVRSRIMRDLDRNRRAIRDAQRAIQLAPDNDSGYVEKGRALAILQRRRDALAVFEDAAARFPNSNYLHYWWADTLVDDRQADAAMVVINKAISFEGVAPEDYQLKAYIAQQLGDWAVMQNAAEEAIALDEGSPWGHFYLAKSMLHVGQEDQALDRVLMALEKGLPKGRVGEFAADLIAAGQLTDAIKLRLRH